MAVPDVDGSSDVGNADTAAVAAAAWLDSLVLASRPESHWTPPTVNAALAWCALALETSY
jgi:hypothetical protein